jgi:glyoxylase-like metal-dependent hydrolase (beta-lactamase superfamily II)
VATGDLMESIISYMGDSYPEDWIATLDKLLALDFDTVLPGHGSVFRGKTKIQTFQKYLRSVIDQSLAFKKQGLSADAAAAKVDVTAFRNEFAAVRVGIDARRFDGSISWRISRNSEVSQLRRLDFQLRRKQHRSIVVDGRPFHQRRQILIDARVEDGSCRRQSR